MPPETMVSSDSDLDFAPKCPKISRRNSTGPKYSCTIEGCGASFLRLDHLDRHEYHHTGIKKHICTYEGCAKTYSILTHLKRHVRTTHERIEPPSRSIACDVDGCDKMFTSQTSMQRHIREVHENPKVYECSMCEAKFTQKLKMRRHEIQQHTGNYPHTCTKCGKGFYQQWNFERHQKICKIYPCPDCQLQFEKWSVYLKHCKDTQHGRKYYKCEHCERVYGKPGELQKHIAAKHADSGEQLVYACEHENCDRSYVYERNLRQHMRVAHSGDRFRCTHDDCERDFSSSQNLAKHMERDHNPEVKKPPKEGKKAKRKKRKDAGTSVMSHLSKLSGLAVDRDLDKLLRQREEGALTAVSLSLSREMPATEEDSVLESSDRSMFEELVVSDKDMDKEKELDSLIADVLSEEIN